jgi:hypothetical protein
MGLTPSREVRIHRHSPQACAQALGRAGAGRILLPGWIDQQRMQARLRGLHGSHITVDHGGTLLREQPLQRRNRAVCGSLLG